MKGDAQGIINVPLRACRHSADSCGQLQTLWGVCMERVWGRPLGYVTLWDPKEHFSEENFSPGGPGATPHHAYSHAVPT